MYKQITSFIVLAVSLGLFGCNQGGSGDAASSAPASEAASPSSAPAPSGGDSAAAATSDEAPVSRSSEGTVYIDHAKDEIEFRLKNSIDGLTELLDDYRAKGVDSTELEAQIASLKKELSNL